MKLTDNKNINRNVNTTAGGSTEMQSPKKDQSQGEVESKAHPKDRQAETKAEPSRGQPKKETPRKF